MKIKKYLNQQEYQYQWSNNSKPTYQILLYKSKLKIDKSKGEEVNLFIEGFLEKHGLAHTQKNIQTIEDALHKNKNNSKEELQTLIEKEFEFYTKSN